MHAVAHHFNAALDRGALLLIKTRRHSDDPFHVAHQIAFGRERVERGLATSCEYDNQERRASNQSANERRGSARCPKGDRASTAWACRRRTRSCDAAIPITAGWVGLARSRSAPVALPRVEGSPITSSKSS